jgi:hypothetical protein
VALARDYFLACFIPLVPPLAAPGQNRLPFPISLRLLICSVVERRQVALIRSSYTTRQFAWFPDGPPAQCQFQTFFAWKLSLRASFAACFSANRYLRRLRRSTISRYRSGSRRFR